MVNCREHISTHGAILWDIALKRIQNPPWDVCSWNVVVLVTGPAPKNGQILTNHSPTSHASNKNRSTLNRKPWDLRVFRDFGLVKCCSQRVHNHIQTPSYMFINYTFLLSNKSTQMIPDGLKILNANPTGCLLANLRAWRRAYTLWANMPAVSLKFDKCIPKNCHSWKEFPSFQITMF